MQLEYDLNVGALYIRLSDEEVARTQEVGGNAVVDIDAAGNLVGIEVISAVHPWPIADILRDYQLPEQEVAQLRAYFRVDESCLLQPTTPAFKVATRPPALAAA